MLTTIIRTVILYFSAVISVRLMGKRQIGELQPTELVVTILLSEIAAIPIQDNDIPLINSLIPLMLLVGFEIILSVINVNNVRFRKISDGNPFIIVRDGVPDQKKLKMLRLSVDDILSALRQKDVFDISDVQYAIMETNGSVSVLLKPEKRNLSPGDMKIETEDKGFLSPVILDGRLLKNHLHECNKSFDDIMNELNNQNYRQDSILLMTVDKNGNYSYIFKDKKESE